MNETSLDLPDQAGRSQAGSMGSEIVQETPELSVEEQELRQESHTFLGRIVKVVMSETRTGYAIRTALEMVPLGPWAGGDILGLIKGLQALKEEERPEAVLKIVAAVIPGVPTALTQAGIRWAFQRRREKRLAKIGMKEDSE